MELDLTKCQRELTKALGERDSAAQDLTELRARNMQLSAALKSKLDDVAHPRIVALEAEVERLRGERNEARAESKRLKDLGDKLATNLIDYIYAIDPDVRNGVEALEVASRLFGSAVELVPLEAHKKADSDYARVVKAINHSRGVKPHADSDFSRAG